MKKRCERGLSTGQTAAYCLVGAATIVNWIKSGRLRAQRTAGGQFRIRRSDLRQFMLSTGMRTDQLDHDLRPHCWEWMMNQRAEARPPCLTCRVRADRVFDCFDVRSSEAADAPPCSTCSYFATWSATQG